MSLHGDLVLERHLVDRRLELLTVGIQDARWEAATRRLTLSYTTGAPLAITLPPAVTPERLLSVAEQCPRATMAALMARLGDPDPIPNLGDWVATYMATSPEAGLALRRDIVRAEWSAMRAALTAPAAQCASRWMDVEDVLAEGPSVDVSRLEHPVWGVLMRIELWHASQLGAGHWVRVTVAPEAPRWVHDAFHGRFCALPPRADWATLQAALCCWLRDLSDDLGARQSARE